MRPVPSCSLARALALAGAVALLGACGRDTADADAADLTPVGQQGRDTAASEGCAACHSVTGGASVGPAWNDVWGTEIVLDDGATVIFDADYVRRSVREPAAQRRPGGWIQMPAFTEAALTDDQLALVTAYIEELATP